MAKRRVKKRTHVGAKGAPPGSVPIAKSGERTPKSMVIRIGAGEVGPSVSQLVKDVRSMMEPGTASRLKERRSNKLRDYTTMAGPLGVSHLMLFSRSTSGNTNMRLAITPRGPTLHFRVEKYSLCKDVMKAIRHPKSGKSEYLTAPLLVMNNFTTPENSTNTPIPKQLESLTTTVFQSLFPPISPTATPLTSIKRVLLLNRETSSPEDGTYILNLRHYAITTKRTGLPRSIRRLNAAEKLLSSAGQKRKRGLPDLGKLDDVADYLLDPSAGGYTSASETEAETDAEVEVLATSARKVLNKRDMQRRRDAADGEEKRSNGTVRSGVERRAVKLVELGPRMKLRFTKIEEGVCTGKVMWHEFINKSKEEIKQMDKVWDERRKIKEERRREQKANVEKKRKERDTTGGEAGEDYNLDNEDLDMDDDEWDSEGLDEAGDGEDEDIEGDEEEEEA
ncbi:hypothetical protein B0A49_09341 [Cryomyces minteri]|uniref:Brix domain-containing protein n=1 Tax=Cryomyces minteri TaxID=331657 RepID=A0A4U0WHB0_9PEZI|nr:hypothetical protein B0A49_09341 [Cryomyces minteri]